MPDIDAVSLSSVDTLQKQSDESSASFLRAARAGNLPELLDLLKAGTNINTCNANGLNALHIASKEGHADVVAELLARGADVDAATKKGNTALHIASLAGQLPVVTLLVEHNANVNVQSQDGFTPLYMAAQENHDRVVTFLLQHGANQSLATEEGFTPLAVALQQGHDRVVAILLENDTRGRVRLPALHIAAKKDDTKAAALLLQSDHNPDVTSKSGFTPLHIAAHYGNENMAKLLLEKGANVNFLARHNITPLHVASKWGRANLVSLLLAHGAVIDCRTKDLLTPLHCAARSGHEQIVDLLLEKGAPISAKSKNGLAPLHNAAQGDHADTARILLYHRAPVDEVTVDYLTALHIAAHYGHVRTAKLLLDRNADPNARALNGFTPLHVACKKNRIKVVELLLKYQAALQATTESGLTPLHVAAFMGCMNIVVYLIQHGARPDDTTVHGETPLHLAARAYQTDVVRILLRNGATVDAAAREGQTPLHIASRLGNTDIVMLLLQHGAKVDATARDNYTPLHIAAKEGHEDVVTILLDHNASCDLKTGKGYLPIHLASKYGNLSVVQALLEKGAEVDAQGKNQVTPLHVAAHYNHQQVALQLLEHNASPLAAAKNGFTPLHIVAKKNQMDIAPVLLEYHADVDAESKAGFTPLHLASENGHVEMAAFLIENGSNVNAQAKNGLTPMHMCAQNDHVEVAQLLKDSGAELNLQTKSGYTPLHVACHFGQINMVRFLLENGADLNIATLLGYTPLHQAAQQGHGIIVKMLIDYGASPNALTSTGQTPLAIAQKLGYVSVVETLRTVTETTIITETTTITEERYKVQSPETMQETFISESEDEGDDAAMVGSTSFENEIHRNIDLQEDLLPMDKSMEAEQLQLENLIKKVQQQPFTPSSTDYGFDIHLAPDNIDVVRSALHSGKLMTWKSFLVSFLVDARGGAMRGCRHSGVRVIIPPRKAPMPMRITCRYLRREKLIHPPPLNEGEALASRILEMGPAGAKFLGPVIIEVPHFASLRGREREIVILRSENGEHWKEHSLEATEDAVQEVLNESFDPEELSQLDDLNTTRITRILSSDFPQYFALVTRIRQEVHAVGPEGGMIASTVVPQVQALFPEGALTKTIKVSLQAHGIPQDLVTKLHGNRVAVSPIVTVEPRRRKFHKPITLCIPLPQSTNKGMITQYSAQTGQDPPTLRLLCSITGGTAAAKWEDITGTTQLTFSNDNVSFTTTVSARFWLMDCQTPRESARMAQEIYNEGIVVPYMAKFIVFARRPHPNEGQLRLFCVTDDKEDKTLERQEHYKEIAKSRDVEVLASRFQHLEFAGNLIPVTKSGEQLSLRFIPFQENRLMFLMKLRDFDDPDASATGRLAIMREPKQRAEALPPQHPICTLAITLPAYSATSGSDTLIAQHEQKVLQLAEAVEKPNVYTASRDSDTMYNGVAFRRIEVPVSYANVEQHTNGIMKPKIDQSRVVEEEVVISPTRFGEISLAEQPQRQLRKASDHLEEVTGVGFAQSPPLSEIAVAQMKEPVAVDAATPPVIDDLSGIDGRSVITHMPDSLGSSVGSSEQSDDTIICRPEADDTDAVIRGDRLLYDEQPAISLPPKDLRLDLKGNQSFEVTNVHSVSEPCPIRVLLGGRKPDDRLSAESETTSTYESCAAEPMTVDKLAYDRGSSGLSPLQAEEWVSVATSQSSSPTTALLSDREPPFSRAEITASDISLPYQTTASLIVDDVQQRQQQSLLPTKHELERMSQTKSDAISVSSVGRLAYRDDGIEPEPDLNEPVSYLDQYASYEENARNLSSDVKTPTVSKRASLPREEKLLFKDSNLEDLETVDPSLSYMEQYHKYELSTVARDSLSSRPVTSSLPVAAAEATGSLFYKDSCLEEEDHVEPGVSYLEQYKQHEARTTAVRQLEPSSSLTYEDSDLQVPDHADASALNLEHSEQLEATREYPVTELKPILSEGGTLPIKEGTLVYEGSFEEGKQELEKPNAQLIASLSSLKESDNYQKPDTDSSLTRAPRLSHETRTTTGPLIYHETSLEPVLQTDPNLSYLDEYHRYESSLKEKRSPSLLSEEKTSSSAQKLTMDTGSLVYQDSSVEQLQQTDPNLSYLEEYNQHEKSLKKAGPFQHMMSSSGMVKKWTSFSSEADTPGSLTYRDDSLETVERIEPVVSYLEEYRQHEVVCDKPESSSFSSVTDKSPSSAENENAHITPLVYRESCLEATEEQPDLSVSYLEQYHQYEQSLTGGPSVKADAKRMPIHSGEREIPGSLTYRDDSLETVERIEPVVSYLEEYRQHEVVCDKPESSSFSSVTDKSPSSTENENALITPLVYRESCLEAAEEQPDLNVSYLEQYHQYEQSLTGDPSVKADAKRMSIHSGEGEIPGSLTYEGDHLEPVDQIEPVVSYLEEYHKHESMGAKTVPPLSSTSTSSNEQSVLPAGQLIYQESCLEATDKQPDLSVSYLEQYDQFEKSLKGRSVPAMSAFAKKSPSLSSECEVPGSLIYQESSVESVDRTDPMVSSYLDEYCLYENASKQVPLAASSNIQKSLVEKDAVHTGPLFYQESVLEPVEQQQHDQRMSILEQYDDYELSLKPAGETTARVVTERSASLHEEDAKIDPLSHKESSLEPVDVSCSALGYHVSQDDESQDNLKKDVPMGDAPAVASKLPSSGEIAHLAYEDNECLQPMEITDPNLSYLEQYEEYESSTVKVIPAAAEVGKLSSFDKDVVAAGLLTFEENGLEPMVQMDPTVSYLVEYEQFEKNLKGGGSSAESAFVKLPSFEREIVLAEPLSYRYSSLEQVDSAEPNVSYLEQYREYEKSLKKKDIPFVSTFAHSASFSQGVPSSPSSSLTYHDSGLDESERCFVEGDVVEGLELYEKEVETSSSVVKPSDSNDDTAQFGSLSYKEDGGLQDVDKVDPHVSYLEQYRQYESSMITSRAGTDHTATAQLNVTAPSASLVYKESSLVEPDQTSSADVNIRQYQQKHDLLPEELDRFPRQLMDSSIQPTKPFSSALTYNDPGLEETADTDMALSYLKQYDEHEASLKKDDVILQRAAEDRFDSSSALVYKDSGLEKVAQPVEGDVSYLELYEQHEANLKKKGSDGVAQLHGDEDVIPVEALVYNDSGLDEVVADQNVSYLDQYQQEVPSGKKSSSIKVLLDLWNTTTKAVSSGYSSAGQADAEAKVPATDVLLSKTSESSVEEVIPSSSCLTYKDSSLDEMENVDPGTSYMEQYHQYEASSLKKPGTKSPPVSREIPTSSSSISYQESNVEKSNLTEDVKPFAAADSLSPGVIVVEEDSPGRDVSLSYTPSSLDEVTEGVVSMEPSVSSAITDRRVSYETVPVGQQRTAAVVLDKPGELIYRDSGVNEFEADNGDASDGHRSSTQVVRRVVHFVEPGGRGRTDSDLPDLISTHSDVWIQEGGRLLENVNEVTLNVEVRRGQDSGEFVITMPERKPLPWEMEPLKPEHQTVQDKKEQDNEKNRVSSSAENVETSQETETLEEGYVEDGHLVSTKKIMRVVTTTRTLSEGPDGKPIQKTVTTTQTFGDTPTGEPIVEEISSSPENLYAAGPVGLVSQCRVMFEKKLPSSASMLHQLPLDLPEMSPVEDNPPQVSQPSRELVGTSPSEERSPLSEGHLSERVEQEQEESEEDGVSVRDRIKHFEQWDMEMQRKKFGFPERVGSTLMRVSQSSTKGADARLPQQPNLDGHILAAHVVEDQIRQSFPSEIHLVESAPISGSVSQCCELLTVQKPELPDTEVLRDLSTKPTSTNASPDLPVSFADQQLYVPDVGEQIPSLIDADDKPQTVELHFESNATALSEITVDQPSDVGRDGRADWEQQLLRVVAENEAIAQVQQARGGRMQLQTEPLKQQEITRVAADAVELPTRSDSLSSAEQVLKLFGLDEQHMPEQSQWHTASTLQEATDSQFSEAKKPVSVRTEQRFDQFLEENASTEIEQFEKGVREEEVHKQSEQERYTSVVESAAAAESVRAVYEKSQSVVGRPVVSDVVGPSLDNLKTTAILSADDTVRTVHQETGKMTPAADELEIRYCTELYDLCEQADAVPVESFVEHRLLDYQRASLELIPEAHAQKTEEWTAEAGLPVSEPVVAFQDLPPTAQGFQTDDHRTVIVMTPSLGVEEPVLSVSDTAVLHPDDEKHHVRVVEQCSLVLATEDVPVTECTDQVQHEWSNSIVTTDQSTSVVCKSEIVDLEDKLRSTGKTDMQKMETSNGEHDVAHMSAVVDDVSDSEMELEKKSAESVVGECDSGQRQSQTDQQLTRPGIAGEEEVHQSAPLLSTFFARDTVDDVEKLVKSPDGLTGSKASMELILKPGDNVKTSGTDKSWICGKMMKSKHEDSLDLIFASVEAVDDAEIEMKDKFIEKKLQEEQEQIAAAPVAEQAALDESYLIYSSVGVISGLQQHRRVATQFECGSLVPVYSYSNVIDGLFKPMNVCQRSNTAATEQSDSGGLGDSAVGKIDAESSTPTSVTCYDDSRAGYVPFRRNELLTDEDRPADDDDEETVFCEVPPVSRPYFEEAHDRRQIPGHLITDSAILLHRIHDISEGMLSPDEHFAPAVLMERTFMLSPIEGSPITPTAVGEGVLPFDHGQDHKTIIKEEDESALVGGSFMSTGSYEDSSRLAEESEGQAHGIYETCKIGASQSGDYRTAEASPTLTERSWRGSLLAEEEEEEEDNGEKQKEKLDVVGAPAPATLVVDDDAPARSGTSDMEFHVQRSYFQRIGSAGSLSPEPGADAELVVDTEPFSPEPTTDGGELSADVIQSTVNNLAHRSTEDYEHHPDPETALPAMEVLELKKDGDESLLISSTTYKTDDNYVETFTIGARPISVEFYKDTTVSSKVEQSDDADVETAFVRAVGHSHRGSQDTLRSVHETVINEPAGFAEYGIASEIPVDSSRLQTSAVEPSPEVKFTQKMKGMFSGMFGGLSSKKVAVVEAVQQRSESAEQISRSIVALDESGASVPVDEHIQSLIRVHSDGLLTMLEQRSQEEALKRHAASTLGVEQISAERSLAGPLMHSSADATEEGGGNAPSDVAVSALTKAELASSFGSQISIAESGWMKTTYRVVVERKSSGVDSGADNDDAQKLDDASVELHGNLPSPTGEEDVPEKVQLLSELDFLSEQEEPLNDGAVVAVPAPEICVTRASLISGSPDTDDIYECDAAETSDAFFDNFVERSTAEIDLSEISQPPGEESSSRIIHFNEHPEPSSLEVDSFEFSADTESDVIPAVEPEASLAEQLVDDVLAEAFAISHQAERDSRILLDSLSTSGEQQQTDKYSTYDNEDKLLSTPSDVEHFSIPEELSPLCMTDQTGFVESTAEQQRMEMDEHEVSLPEVEASAASADPCDTALSALSQFVEFERVTRAVISDIGLEESFVDKQAQPLAEEEQSDSGPFPLEEVHQQPAVDASMTTGSGDTLPVQPVAPQPHDSMLEEEGNLQNQLVEKAILDSLPFYSYADVHAGALPDIEQRISDSTRKEGSGASTLPGEFAFVAPVASLNLNAVADESKPEQKPEAERTEHEADDDEHFEALSETDTPMSSAFSVGAGAVFYPTEDSSGSVDVEVSAAASVLSEVHEQCLTAPSDHADKLDAADPVAAQSVSATDLLSVEERGEGVEDGGVFSKIALDEHCCASSTAAREGVAPSAEMVAGGELITKQRGGIGDDHSFSIGHQPQLESAVADEAITDRSTESQSTVPLKQSEEEEEKNVDENCILSAHRDSAAALITDVLKVAVEEVREAEHALNIEAVCAEDVSSKMLSPGEEFSRSESFTGTVDDQEISAVEHEPLFEQPTLHLLQQHHEGHDDKSASDATEECAFHTGHTAVDFPESSAVATSAEKPMSSDFSIHSDLLSSETTPADFQLHPGATDRIDDIDAQQHCKDTVVERTVEKLSLNDDAECGIDAGDRNFVSEIDSSAVCDAADVNVGSNAFVSLRYDDGSGLDEDSVCAARLTFTSEGNARTADMESCQFSSDSLVDQEQKQVLDSFSPSVDDISEGKAVDLNLTVSNLDQADDFLCKKSVVDDDEAPVGWHAFPNEKHEISSAMTGNKDDDDDDIQRRLGTQQDAVAGQLSISAEEAGAGGANAGNSSVHSFADTADIGKLVNIEDVADSVGHSQLSVASTICENAEVGKTPIQDEFKVQTEGDELEIRCAEQFVIDGKQDSSDAQTLVHVDDPLVSIVHHELIGRQASSEAVVQHSSGEMVSVAVSPSKEHSDAVQSTREEDDYDQEWVFVESPDENAELAETELVEAKVGSPYPVWETPIECLKWSGDQIKEIPPEQVVQVDQSPSNESETVSDQPVLASVGSFQMSSPEVDEVEPACLDSEMVYTLDDGLIAEVANGQQQSTCPVPVRPDDLLLTSVCSEDSIEASAPFVAEKHEVEEQQSQESPVKSEEQSPDMELRTVAEAEVSEEEAVGSPWKRPATVRSSKHSSMDNVSDTSSLLEFERFERELMMNIKMGDSSVSSSETEALNLPLANKRSSNGSVSSLAEFERLERECEESSAQLTMMGTSEKCAQGTTAEGGGESSLMMTLSDIKEESDSEDVQSVSEPERDSFATVVEQQVESGRTTPTVGEQQQQQIMFTTSMDSLEGYAMRMSKQQAQAQDTNLSRSDSLEPEQDSNLLQSGPKIAAESIMFSSDKDSLIASTVSEMSTDETDNADGLQEQPGEGRALLSCDTIGTFQEYGDEELLAERDSLCGDLEESTIVVDEQQHQQPDADPDTPVDERRSFVTDCFSGSRSFGGTAVGSGNAATGAGGDGDFVTSLTRFETRRPLVDGSYEVITRTVSTRETDPVNSRIRFTGSESIESLTNAMLSRSGSFEQFTSTDEQGNVTTTVVRRVSGGGPLISNLRAGEHDETGSHSIQSGVRSSESEWVWQDSGPHTTLVMRRDHAALALQHHTYYQQQQQQLQQHPQLQQQQSSGVTGVRLERKLSDQSPDSDGSGDSLEMYHSNA